MNGGQKKVAANIYKTIWTFSAESVATSKPLELCSRAAGYSEDSRIALEPPTTH